MVVGKGVGGGGDVCSRRRQLRGRIGSPRRMAVSSPRLLRLAILMTTGITYLVATATPTPLRPICPNLGRCRHTRRSIATPMAVGLIGSIQNGPTCTFTHGAQILLRGQCPDTQQMCGRVTNGATSFTLTLIRTTHSIT